MPRLNKTDWLLESLIRPVTLFNNLPVMEEAIVRFRLHEYTVHEFDCSEHESQETMFNAVLHSLNVLQAGYTYKNIQTIQFWDLLRDIKVPEETGLVLAFKNFDVFYHRLPESGQQMLSSITREHFYKLGHGYRMITLAHSNDRNLELEPLLIIRADWNKSDTFTEEADRRLVKFQKYMDAWREVSKWLHSHVESRLKIRTLDKALLDVTGASDMKALIEIGLDAADMIRLLQNYDFSPFEVSEDAQKAAEGKRRRRAAFGQSTPEAGAE